MPIVAFTGKARHGKDTSAKALKQLLEARGKQALIVGFADALRELCDDLFGNDLRQITDSTVISFFDEEAKDVTIYPQITGGMILQKIGGLLRSIDESYWVERFDDKYGALVASGCWVLVKDCRYPNEEDYVRSLGGKIVRCVRTVPSDPNRDSGHHSETEMDKIKADILLDNNQEIPMLPGALGAYFTPELTRELER